MAKRNINEAVLTEARGAYEDVITTGLSLCERSEKKGGWAEYFDGDLNVEDDVVKAHTAVMLENCRRWLGSLDEATRAVQVGGWVDYLYPIIRASFPNNPLHEMVSVQPQTKRVGLIFWMNYIIGRTIGEFSKGHKLFDASTGWSGQVGYTDETVTNENLPVDAASATYTAQLNERPVRRSQVLITFNNGGATVAIKDDGNGGFALVTAGGGITTVNSGSIDYNTGEFTVTFNAALAGSNAVSASYQYDGEMSETLPQIDVEIASSSIEAIRRAVSLRYSTEAAQDFNAEFGMNLDQVIVSGCSQALIADTCGEVIRDLWDMSGSPVASFSASTYNPATSGYSRREYFGDLIYPLNQASVAIYDETQKAEGTFLVCDLNAETILETLGRPMWEPAPGNTSKQQGCVFIGTLNGKYRVYRYKPMSNFPTASAQGNILMGYKGPDFWDAGYVWAPYQALYMSPKDRRWDLTTRQAMAMRYGKKRVNTAMYKRVSIT